MAESKATKASVNYRDGRGARICANCTKFRAPHGCLHVAGFIRRNAVCDRFVSASKHNWYGKKD